MSILSVTPTTRAGRLLYKTRLAGRTVLDDMAFGGIRCGGRHAMLAEGRAIITPSGLQDPSRSTIARI
jgi:hypothetical protein